MHLLPPLVSVLPETRQSALPLHKELRGAAARERAEAVGRGRELRDEERVPKVVLALQLPPNGGLLHPLQGNGHYGAAGLRRLRVHPLLSI